MLENNCQPPYFAVFFSSKLSDNTAGYDRMSQKMTELAKKQPGFLGIETARSELGITVSYWKSLESIEKWRANTQHQEAISKGIKQWYSDFSVRVCKVLR